MLVDHFENKIRRIKERSLFKKENHNKKETKSHETKISEENIKYSIKINSILKELEKNVLIYPKVVIDTYLEKFRIRN